MKIYETAQDPYYEHGRHSVLQLLIFAIICLIGIAVTINIALPFLKNFFEENLHGYVYAVDENVPYYLESKDNLQTTNWLFSWAVDLYKDTPNESRYWFNPFMIVIIEASFIGVIIAMLITTLLPYNLGVMRQKIEREISNMLDQIEYIKYGYHSKEGQKEIVDELLHLDSYNFQEYSEDINMHTEDLRVFVKALKWKYSDFSYRLWHINDGIQIYMRFHFTAKYSNAVLGFVYIGAAFLIVIIGLRGLKFIPPNEPTYVMFALGMEFTMLVAYAITLIYSRQDEEMEMEKSTREASAASLGTELGDSREVEKLLRVFIKSDKNKE